MIFQAAAVLMLTIAIGCQSTTTPTAQVMSDNPNAVVVTYPNGGGTTVFLRSTDPENPIVMCSPGTTVCPVCKAAAIKYFQTGVLDPKCSLTGASRYVVSYTAPSVSHN